MNKTRYITTLISILMATSSNIYSNNYRSENVDPDDNKKEAELIVVTSFGTQKESNIVPISSRSRRCPRIQIIKKMLTSCCSCTSSKG